MTRSEAWERRLVPIGSIPVVSARRIEAAARRSCATRSEAYSRARYEIRGVWCPEAVPPWIAVPVLGRVLTDEAAEALDAVVWCQAGGLMRCPWRSIEIESEENHV
jgi:hypothetical protein